MIPWGFLGIPWRFPGVSLLLYIDINRYPSLGRIKARGSEGDNVSGCNIFTLITKSIHISIFSCT